MAYRTPNPPEGTEQIDPWPYDVMPRRAHTKGPWQMGMNASGSMVIWPGDKPLPDGLIIAFRGEKEQLERFQVTFCMRGYETNPVYKYQDGTVWLFNWISETLAQVYIAGQVAEKHFSGDYDGAWEVGRAFEDRLRAAEAEVRA